MRTASLWLIAVALLEAAPPADAPVFEGGRVLPSGGDRPIPLAPGLLISIYGIHLGPSVGCRGYADSQRETPSPLRQNQMFEETLSYPKSLCDTQVFIGGIPAGLLYVQEGQINFKVPQETPVTGTAEVRVVYQGQSGRPVSLPLGLESAVLSLETPAAVGMPVWLKVWAFGWDESIQYPFDILPANFNCTDIEVRRDGKLLPRFASPATQAFGAMAHSGPMCGTLGLRAQSNHLGRVPLHLQYRFDRPGIYEVRYTFRNGWGPGEPARLQSAWTRIEILPGSPAQRSRWLAEVAARAPTDTVELLTDFLPSILGVPDEASLQLLGPYLYHPDSLVRQFAMYGLTYWPAEQANAAVAELVRTRGPSDAIVRFLSLRSKLTAAQADSIVESAIPNLRSNSAVMLLGAVDAIDRIALPRDSPLGVAVRAHAENALIEAASRIEDAGDADLASRYAVALSAVEDERAGVLLWDLVHRDIARGQAAIAIAWRKAPADLPKLAQLTLEPAHGNNRDYSLTSLPYALHRAYGDAALPYLETMLERSEFTWVRTDSARELIVAGRPSGFAFIVDALEHDRPYRREMIQYVRDRFPELRRSGDATILSFIRARAAK